LLKKKNLTPTEDEDHIQMARYYLRSRQPINKFITIYLALTCLVQVGK